MCRLSEADLFCYVWWFPALSFPCKCLSWLRFTQSIQARLLLRAGHSSHTHSPCMCSVWERGALVTSPGCLCLSGSPRQDSLPRVCTGLPLWPTLAQGCLQRNVLRLEECHAVFCFLFSSEYNCPLWVGGCGLFCLKPSIKPHRSPWAQDTGYGNLNQSTN